MGGPADLATPEVLTRAGSQHLTRVRSVFDDENVVGAGIAQKVSEGKVLDELSLVFYVRRKIPRSQLTDASAVPPVVVGKRGKAVFTDVIEVGEIVPQSNAGRPPLRSGFSIGHFNSTAGTLGALVRSRRKVYALSNAHVFAEAGLAAVGDAILYPGPADGGMNPHDVVANFTASRRSRLTADS